MRFFSIRIICDPASPTEDNEYNVFYDYFAFPNNVLVNQFRG